MGMKSACGRLLCRRSKLHYGECSEQTAGWSGGELKAAGRGSSSGGSQASAFYAAGQGPTVCCCVLGELVVRQVSGGSAQRDAALQTGECLQAQWIEDRRRQLLRGQQYF